MDLAGLADGSYVTLYPACDLCVDFNKIVPFRLDEGHIGARFDAYAKTVMLDGEDVTDRCMEAYDGNGEDGWVLLVVRPGSDAIVEAMEANESTDVIHVIDPRNYHLVDEFRRGAVVCAG